ncbi:hypothetical protein KFU94_60855, partial [Chloroflexi bacterium TSY]|nr:hypothetical protein [Chloroflexi bacterium TSY]
MVSMTEFWRKETVAVSNRLRSCLLRYHPALLNVFSWPSPIAAHLILAYPSPQAAEKQPMMNFRSFKQHKHNQPSKWLTCFDALTTQHPVQLRCCQACQVQSNLPTLAPYPQLQASNTPTALFLQHEDHPFCFLCRA